MRLASGPDTRRALPTLAAVYAEGADAADVVLGFRRLAIVDLSDGGAQPMCSADGRTAVVFNGEIYNHRVLRSALIERGHRFASGSDTEVLLAAYREWGVECVDHLNGMWAFCILDLDRPDAPLFLSRDRLGEKPLYVAESRGGLVFGSEIKAVLSLLDTAPSPDEAAVHDFLLDAGMPSALSGRTFFEGVRQVPGGHSMLVGVSTRKLWPYWTVPDGGEADGELSPSIDDAIHEFVSLFDDSVDLRLQADVAVGSCLSGGLDSSLIVTTAGERHPSADRRTFTAAYEEPGRHDERAFASQVSDRANAVPTLVFPTADGLVADMRSLAWHQDEPFASPSIYAQWCVMRSARAAGVPVVLDGQGADELFGGYQPFGHVVADSARSGRFNDALTATSVLSKELGVPSWKTLSKGGLLGVFGVSGVDRLRAVTPVRRPSTPLANVPWLLRHRSPEIRFDYGAGGLLDQRLRYLTAEKSLPELLRYEDRNSSAHGVEARTPFLDHRIVEKSFGTWRPYRVNPPWTKYLVRRAAAPRVPESIVWRKDKVGFETPERVWQPRMRSLLASIDRSGPLMDLIDVDRCMAGGVDDRALWRAVSVGIWAEVFFGGA